MPITLPPSVQYQGTPRPLPGRWNTAPREGDYYLAYEIDWSATGTYRCVQVDTSNSPVAISQIAALSVDCTSSAVDVQFLFTDSSTTLTVPAGATGVFPVFTNANGFWVNAPGASAGDLVRFLILNSVPPPVAVPTTYQQETAGQAALSNATGTHAIVGQTVYGTLQAFDITMADSGGGVAAFQLIDGASNVLWSAAVATPAGAATTRFALSNLRVPFAQGVKLAVTGSTYAGGTISATVYYSVP